MTVPDLLTSKQAEALLPPMANGQLRRLEPFVRKGAIEPAMRAGSGTRSPLLFHREDVLALRESILDGLREQIAATAAV